MVYAAAQLMLALDYCHKIGVSSRDVKLENTLLEKAPGRRPMLKLCGAPQLLFDPAQLTLIYQVAILSRLNVLLLLCQCEINSVCNYKLQTLSKTAVFERV